MGMVYELDDIERRALLTPDKANTGSYQMNGYFHNSTFRIKEDAPQMKRGGRLRPIRRTHPDSDARLKQDLTKVLSKYVRLRDPVCIVCRSARSNNAGHFYHRDMPSVEFDPRNVWGICSDCNYRHETVPEPMRGAVLARLGERSFADLTELANNHKMKLGRNELEILLSELIEKVEDQTGIKLRGKRRTT
jgi:NinG protein